mmetsp:Transcript_66053/g.151394  ORF Transcript_66053/g.151394 Transcript_66053/m.151394 type:complete len:246 (+) Transcript_66053:707-1444(+)
MVLPRGDALAERPQRRRVRRGALEDLEGLADDLLGEEPAHVDPRVVHVQHPERRLGLRDHNRLKRRRRRRVRELPQGRRKRRRAPPVGPAVEGREARRAPGVERGEACWRGRAVEERLLGEGERPRGAAAHRRDDEAEGRALLHVHRRHVLEHPHAEGRDARGVDRVEQRAHVQLVHEGHPRLVVVHESREVLAAVAHAVADRGQRLPVGRGALQRRHCLPEDLRAGEPAHLDPRVADVHDAVRL